jgi:hypothetical protein
MNPKFKQFYDAIREQYEELIRVNFRDGSPEDDYVVALGKVLFQYERKLAFKGMDKFNDVRPRW